jgi:hypothetical protein
MVGVSEMVYSKTNQKGALEGSKRQRRSIEVSGVPLWGCVR